MAINQLEVLRHNLQTQNEQGKALVEMIDRVEGIESNVNEKYSEIKGMVTEVRDRVTIDYEGQQVLKSIVWKKSTSIAQSYYEYNDDYGAEIKELKGYATRHHWKLLKDYFRVTRYTSIRHVDFDKAKEFLKGIVVDKSFYDEYERWKLERAKKREREIKRLKEQGKEGDAS
jgi:hypothetical protein